MKRHTELILSRIAGEDTTAEIEKVETNLLNLLPPKSYDGAESAEVKMVRAYEQSCAIMSQHIAKDPKQMTVMEFYQTLEILKQQAKKQNGKSN